MIYPKTFEQKVGMDQVKEHLRQNCISEMGKRFVDKIRFSSNAGIIKKLLEQSYEMVTLLTTGSSFPAKDFFDMRGWLTNLTTPGSYIEQDVLFSLKSSLETIRNILDYFSNVEREDFPELLNLTDEVDFPFDLLPEAERIIDEKGEIRDNASPRLAEIRKTLVVKQSRVLRETKKAFEQAKKAGYVPENSEITIRGGRPVIPLNASDKRSIGGIIHDESATGQTVFVEAPASFEINNEIRELENEEKREIIKILMEFTNKLRPYIPDLFNAYRFLGLIDFIYAKAKFAIQTKANKPTLTITRPQRVKDAVHPLLFLTLAELEKKVVPMSMELNRNQRLLIISGPNAGGKSVCLKTTGLLQYMLQCGLLIPVSPDSVYKVFKNIFIDIGDEQSLENDLSTYSSHLLNMKYFLRNANEDTLILIDEFGTGTEPQLGGSIAEATLEQLNEKGAYGVITTHYTNIKLSAEKLSGVVNGAMLFDSKEMMPLYQLQVGKPGSSFAYEIARKIGFPAYVLKEAKKKSGGKHVRFDQQLQQLEIDKIKLQKQKQKASSDDANLNRMIDEYTELITELEKSKKKILKDAQEQALRIIESSNKAVEKTIREIKEAAADKEKTKEIRRELEKKKDELIKDEKVSVSSKKRKRLAKKVNKETEVKKQAEGKTESIMIGDWVKLVNSSLVGELVSLDGKDAIVNVNDIKITTTLNKLQRSGAPKKHDVRRKSYSDIVNDINEKAANFNLKLDLRGKRADEALSDLKKYIDEAILLNQKEVNILHGKGFGILRQLIREYIQSVY